MKPHDRNRTRNQAQLEERDKGLAEIKHFLRQTAQPLSVDQLEPRTDLWPRLRSRIESRSPSAALMNTPIPWFDWALAALAATALLLFPGIIPALLYHF